MSIDAILRAIEADLSQQGLKASDLEVLVPGVSRTTINRLLSEAINEGRLERIGAGPQTRYILSKAVSSPAWSGDALDALKRIAQPITHRNPVGYRTAFHQRYTPNESSHLGADLCATLFLESKISDDHEPAGTYLKQLLEPLLIDMSWSSSKLEGNAYSLADTKELFRRVEQGTIVGQVDRDAVMLLNHKEAIQFMADAAPSYGLTEPIAMELHRLLMSGLLANEASLGSIRQTLVFIHDTSYTPSAAPHFLQEQLLQILEKAVAIKNPVEAAFFLWVNIAYLQPFEDGNKRMSRLLANIPLLIHNCAPLSFLNVDKDMYAKAMIAVYERNDVSVARDLFHWAYRRSINHYKDVLASAPAPDITEVVWREAIKRMVQTVVLDNTELDQAVLDAMADDPRVTQENASALQEKLREIVRTSLDRLAPFNASRFWLAAEQVQAWKDGNRPGDSDDKRRRAHREKN